MDGAEPLTIVLRVIGERIDVLERSNREYEQWVANEQAQHHQTRRSLDAERVEKERAQADASRLRDRLRDQDQRLADLEQIEEGLVRAIGPIPGG